MTTQTLPEQDSGTTRPSRLWTSRNFDLVMATAVIIIVLVPVGMANLYLGFFHGESPCVLCGIERFGMLLIGALGVFILRYGPHYKYVVTLLLAAFFFLYTALRHWAGHALGDLGQGFGGATFGVHTYVWALLIYWVVIAFLAIGMVFVGKDRSLLLELSGQSRPVKTLSLYSKVAVWIVLVLGVTNAVQFLITNGPPPYIGGGDPKRFTLDIGQTSQYWTFEEYEGLANPGLHKFSAPTPLLPGPSDLTGLPTDPTAGPATNVAGTLTLDKTTKIGFPVTGVSGGLAAGLAYDDANDLFALASTDGGLYFVRSDFTTVVSSAKVDVVNGADITDTVDATFLGPNRLLAMAKNKTVYGVERMPADKVDKKAAWADLEESTGDLVGIFGVKDRPKLRTIRAKNAYSLSLAADPATESYYVASVPNEKNPQIVISQFASDNLLSREGVLAIDDSVGTKQGADVSAYSPVGADVHSGHLYLLSVAYRSLLVVDPQTFKVTSVYGLPDLGNPTDLVVKGSTVYVLAHQNGQDVVHSLSGLG